MTGLELKIERIRARKKQFEVAGAIGICPTILCDIENGRRGIEPELLQRILKYLAGDDSQHRNQSANEIAMKQDFCKLMSV